MKYLHVFAIVSCIIIVVSAVPPEALLPGRSGHTLSPDGRLVTMYYGDDHDPQHMEHVERNQSEFPDNRKPMKPANRAVHKKNRDEAINHLPPAGHHHISGEPLVRDEKTPAMLNNPKHRTDTTVEYLPEYESFNEAHLTRNSKNALPKSGGGRIQLKTNRGWLRHNQDQRRAHEAPAILTTQNDSHNGLLPGKVSPQDPSFEHPWDFQPKKSVYKILPKPIGERNFRLGPKKEVWKPFIPLKSGQIHQAGVPLPDAAPPSRASHVGTPEFPKGGEQRHPTRPQNDDHHEKQRQEKLARAKANLEKFNKAFGSGQPLLAGKSQEAPPRLQSHPSQHKSLKVEPDNLKQFNRDFGNPKQGTGSGKSHEAPAKLPSAHRQFPRVKYNNVVGKSHEAPAKLESHSSIHHVPSPPEAPSSPMSITASVDHQTASQITHHAVPSPAEGSKKRGAEVSDAGRLSKIQRFLL
ncbi:hypothetical protein H0H93_005644 [Arthromyces matolae]|nr:hypothetical protein H0H93_005644 [Arthromyces matolae]